MKVIASINGFLYYVLFGLGKGGDKTLYHAPVPIVSVSKVSGVVSGSRVVVGVGTSGNQTFHIV